MSVLISRAVGRDLLAGLREQAGRLAIHACERTAFARGQHGQHQGRPGEGSERADDGQRQLELEFHDDSMVQGWIHQGALQKEGALPVRGGREAVGSKALTHLRTCLSTVQPPT